MEYGNWWDLGANQEVVMVDGTSVKYIECLHNTKSV